MSAHRAYPPPPAPLLVLNQVSRSFGGLLAVDSVSFEIGRGAVVGLIGPNGSGKTTLLNLITSIYPLSGGTISFDGRPIADQPRWELAGRGISRTFQTPRIFSRLDVHQHVLVGLAALDKGQQRSLFASGFFGRRVDREDEVEEILERLDLSADHLRSAESLPYGKRRLLELARCLASRPRLLHSSMSQPLGLNDRETEELGRVLQQLAAERQMSMLVVEHKIDFLRYLCPRLLVMTQGQLLSDGAIEEVLRRPEVIEAYLGEMP